jgi:hypothetical protein
MAASIFDDKSKAPTSAQLDKALGKTAALLKDIEQHLVDEFGKLTREWKFYGKKAGWTLALAHKDRRILHLIPQSGSFTVVLTLGKRAASSALGSKLPTGILSDIENAREYAEGRSVRIDITSAKDVSVVRKLVAIKMSN